MRPIESERCCKFVVESCFFAVCLAVVGWFAGGRDIMDHKKPDNVAVKFKALMVTAVTRC